MIRGPLADRRRAPVNVSGPPARPGALERARRTFRALDEACNLFSRPSPRDHYIFLRFLARHTGLRAGAANSPAMPVAGGSPARRRLARSANRAPHPVNGVHFLGLGQGFLARYDREQLADRLGKVRVRVLAGHLDNVVRELVELVLAVLVHTVSFRRC